MPKRVSLKGKGTDLFFGDYTPETGMARSDGGAAPAPEPAPRTDIAAEPSSPLRDAGGATDADQEPASATRAPSTRPRASRASRPPATPAADAPADAELSTPTAESAEPGIPADVVLEAVWTDVCQPAHITGSFRYTDPELSALGDAVHDLGKRHGVKFSKQDVVRLGLNAVLWDYQSRGDESLLAAFVLRKRRQRGGR